MTKIKSFSQQKTILFSIAVCVIVFLVRKGLGLFFNLLPDNTLCAFLDELVDILWPVALTILLGFRFIYTPKGFGPTLKAGIAIFAFSVFAVLTKYLEAVLVTKVQWETLPIILLGILSMIGIGIREEVIFRGVIGNALALKYATDKKGLWFAMIVSSALFGGVHFTNIFHGVEMTGLIAQIIGAFSAGLLYTAIYLRGGNIWVLVLIHAIEDATGLFASTFTVTAVTEIEQASNLNLGGTIFVACIHICLSSFLLRKSKLPAVFTRLEQLRLQYNQAAVHM